MATSAEPQWLDAESGVCVTAHWQVMLFGRRQSSALSCHLSHAYRAP